MSSLNKRWNKQHQIFTSENPIFCLMNFWAIAWRCLSVKVKKTQVKHSCLLTFGKRAETNPVRPCGAEGLLYKTREQTGQSPRITWQRKGFWFGILSHTPSHSQMGHSQEGEWLFKGRRCFVLEVKCRPAGCSLSQRGQRAGRSPWWHAWCAWRAWTPQSP